MKSRTKWYKPDFLIVPSFIAMFPEKVRFSNNELVQQGYLKTYQLYNQLVIIDAKSGTKFTDSQIGDFFYYFQSPTRELECRVRGMLFNEAEFVLIEFSSGSLERFTRGKLTALGSLEYLRKFLQPPSLSLYFIVQTACEYYGLEPVPHSNFYPGSATLGVGGYGIVLAVMKKEDAKQEEQRQKEREQQTRENISVEANIPSELIAEEEKEDEDVIENALVEKAEEIRTEIDRSLQPPAARMETKEETTPLVDVKPLGIRRYFSPMQSEGSSVEPKQEWSLPQDLPSNVALKIIYKVESMTLDTDYLRGLEISECCPDFVVAPVPGSFRTYKESVNQDWNVGLPSFSSYLMYDVGTAFKPEKPPKRQILREMLVSLGFIHSYGYAHGDARYQNCVLVGKRFKWCDFLHSGKASKDRFKEDLSLFFKSAGLICPKGDVLEEYCSKMISGPWNRPILSLQRSNFLRSMIDLDEGKSGK